MANVSRALQSAMAEEAVERTEDALALPFPFHQLPPELLDNVLGFLSPLELVVLARVCRAWRDSVQRLRTMDAAYTYRCGPADLALFVDKPSGEDTNPRFLAQCLRDSRGLCTCGAISPCPPPGTFDDCVQRPADWPYRARHFMPYPPARWQTLRPERDLALDLARTAAAFDFRLLDMQIGKPPCSWVPLFIHLPDGALRPTTGRGLRNLVNVLLESDFGCADYACPGRYRDRFIRGLANPEIAHNVMHFYQHAGEDGDEEEDDDDNGDGDSNSGAGAGNSGGNSAVVWTLDALRSAPWLTAWTSVGKDNLPSFYSDAVLDRLQLKDSDGWMNLRARPRAHTAQWAHARATHDRTAFLNGVASWHGPAASDDDVFAHLADNVARADALFEQFQQRCTLSVVNTRGTVLLPGLAWIMGLSPRGHIVGAATWIEPSW